MTKIDLASLIARLRSGLYLTTHEHSLLIALRCVVQACVAQTQADHVSETPTRVGARADVIARTLHELGYDIGVSELDARSGALDELLRHAGYTRAATIASRWRMEVV